MSEAIEEAFDPKRSIGWDDPFRQWRGVPDEAVSPERRAARRAAAAVRQLVKGMVGAQVTVESLDELTATVGAATHRLAAAVAEAAASRQRDGDLAGQAAAVTDRLMEQSPVVGRANPLAPPLAIDIRDDTVVGTVTFGRAYESAAGTVHGGHLCAMFDDVLGAAQAFTGQVGMTGKLGVTFRSPAPVETPLRVEARVDRVEGRKTWCAGSLWAGDTLCAEAEAVFITLDPATVKALYERRAAQEGERRSS